MCLEYASIGITLPDMARHDAEKISLSLFAFIIIAFAVPVFADAPKINLFTVDPQSLSNNYSTALAWDTESSTGRELHFSCPSGVTIKKTDGSSFPCNTRQSVGGDPVGWAGFALTNVSGATQNVVVTFYPKDSAGANYDQGAIRRTLSVRTSPQPILDFSVSSTSVASGTELTLVWKGVDAGVVNVQFECADFASIRTSASAVQALPCGKPALAQDLPISGSLIVYPLNSSRAPVSITVRVFPAIGGGMYDATHSLSANFSVLQTPPPATPSAAEFTSSLARIFPNDSFVLSWATRDSAGANIKFSCQDGVSVFAASSTARVILPCNTPAFTPTLAASGSAAFIIKNTNGYMVNLGAVLLPQDAKGIYFQTSSLSLNLSVLPAGTVSTSPAQSQSAPAASISAAVPSASAAPQSSIAPAKVTAPKYTFKRGLYRGLKNADVTALQTQLSLYPDIYPDGLVTGYFGPATERAVKLFQEKYGIAKKGEAGYGTVGPKTRAKLNSLQ